MNWFSMFSGIGGFELGLTRSGHTIVGGCEIDEYARQIYRKHFPDIPLFLDATKLEPRETRDFDGLCAGFPCQTFSIGGKRLGFEESRGTLFFEIARIAKQKRPKLLLLENVVGLLSHDNGRTFAEILATLDEIGYDAEWQVLNSKYFVPQNRERLFIIGYLRGQSRPEIFPIQENDILSTEALHREQETSKRIRCEVSCIDSRYGALRNTGETYLIYQKEIAGCLTGGGNAGGLHSQMTLLSTNNGIRRLTPLECERLQGFPDGWTESISDTQRYKCLGNAVTVPVIEFIGRKIMECMN